MKFHITLDAKLWVYSSLWKLRAWDAMKSIIVNLCWHLRAAINVQKCAGLVEPVEAFFEILELVTSFEKGFIEKKKLSDV